MTTDIKTTLAERGKTHGAFRIHAAVTQDLKQVVNGHLLEQGREWADDMREAVDMICHKLGRVVAGDPNHIDHWDDISGYATLIAERLRNDNTPF